MVQDQVKPKRGRRLVRGAANLVFPLAAVRRFGGDATHARDAIYTAWTELIARIQEQRSLAAREGVVVIVPSPEEGMAIQRNARTVWWCCVGTMVIGIALGAVALRSSSLLTTVNAVVACLALLIAGAVKALDAARAVVEIQQGHPLGWREFIRQPRWYFPY